MEVKGGFNKWSIGRKSNGVDYIVIKADHYPNVMEIELHDVLPQNIEDLARMFTRWDLEIKAEKKEYEKSRKS
jgi:hypothetical protein